MTLHSIIITTYNRPKFLARLLSYFSSQSLAAPIWVADSSAEHAHQEVAKLVHAVSATLNVKLLRFPSEISPFHKIFATLQEIDTPFVALNSDDDFLLPAGLETCVRFLHENPNYSIAHGDYAYFQLSPTSAMSNCHSFTCFPIYQQYRSLEEGAARERLMGQALASAQVSLWSAVHRTDQMRRNFELVIQFMTTVAPSNRWEDAGLRIVSMAQYILQFLSAIEGKSKRLPVLYCLREGHDSNWSLSERSFGRIMLQLDASEKYAAVRRCLATELSRAENIPLEKSGDIIDDVWLLLTAAMLEREGVLSKYRSVEQQQADSFRAGIRYFLQRFHLLALARSFLSATHNVSTKLRNIKEISLGGTGRGTDASKDLDRDLAMIRACVLAHAGQTTMVSSLDNT